MLYALCLFYNSLQYSRIMILWSKTIKIIPLLHFILCVSSHEKSEDILDDGLQCILKNQQCHILNYIDDIKTVNNEGSKKIKTGPSNIQLDIINTEKSKALKEFVKLSRLVMNLRMVEKNGLIIYPSKGFRLIDVTNPMTISSTTNLALSRI